MPRQRITKEFLLEQAYCLVKEQGMDAVSAKSLARLAKCSVQPIYSYYTNMDELKDQIYRKAGMEYRDFLEKNGRRETAAERKAGNAAVAIGMAHVLFAVRAPHLFFLLFQQTQSVLLETMLPHFSEGQVCMEELEGRILGGFSDHETEVAQGFLLFVHGTACMLHSGLAKLDLPRLETLLTHQYQRLSGGAREGLRTEMTSKEAHLASPAPYSWFRGFQRSGGDGFHGEEKELGVR